MKSEKLIDRELSRLAFNGRVLQEAADTDTPLYEKMKFLAIFSSNLDEFFRVRVASIRSLAASEKKELDDLDFNPKKLLKKIRETVDEQQNEFGEIYRKTILPGLREAGVFLVDDETAPPELEKHIRSFFEENVVSFIQPILLLKKKIKPFLQNKKLYFALRLVEKNSCGQNPRRRYAIVEIPTDRLDRFVAFSEVEDKNYVMFLDDIVKFHLKEIFSAFEIEEIRSIKMTRDAELHIDDEFTGKLLAKIRAAIKKRSSGPPSRLLYEARMSKSMLRYLKEAFELDDDDPVPGGRYHNFNDFFNFPIFDREEARRKNLIYEKFPTVESDDVRKDRIFETISERDVALYYPYHSFDAVLDFFDRAADDPEVEAIKTTQYRVAGDSKIAQALMRAARNGKDVEVFVELKARFDEELNIRWAEEMERDGVKVYYSFPGLKVHAKIASVATRSGKKLCYLATGNFNEKTAKVYADLGLFTSDERITSEVSEVFEYLTGKATEHEFKSLLTAQFNIRSAFQDLIKNEIEKAKNGERALIIAKINGLEDTKIIKALYKASRAGVEIKLIVRGICRMKAGVPGLSENVEIISIVDRFLEHARFFYFYAAGEEKIYAGSADWMKRNLSRRVEVVFPIYGSKIKNLIKDILDIQLADNRKARLIDPELKNEYVRNDEPALRSQYAILDLIRVYENQ